MNFNFEKNLPHQESAVKSTVTVFGGLDIVAPTGVAQKFQNPLIELHSGGYLDTYASRIRLIREENKIKEGEIERNSNIIDIMMETGTGKTYTYTKTIFELNKQYGIFKFIVVVPTLSIKAGTINFLQSDSSREHFKEQYGKVLQLHIVESQKSSKSKKSFIPPAITNFAKAGEYEKNAIQVLIINAGMLNSDTMQKSFDRSIVDAYTVPFDAMAAVKPFMIIDEPHKFSQGNKTWENIQKTKPQFILRYGATFPAYRNLIYTLTAVDAFNQNLVKGVVGHIVAYEQNKNAIVRLVDSDGNEAAFELTENDNRKTVKISKGESMSKIHAAMEDLIIENLNRSTVVLSNGIELKRDSRINPYSYAQTLQETMIQRTIENHFLLEKELLTRPVRIKPLTLFFIDNIEEYRNTDGYIRKSVEACIKATIETLLKTETDTYYKSYLQQTLADISLTHGGYFSKDNTEKDEAIEKEINEILHDKQAILDLGNPRRFIFSKWTLREGWDNPNVFQICKLRSSGSDISKLQEVGRGLRLPVNEYGNRIKDEQFSLNYFVDFTEEEFIDNLRDEINDKSGAISIDIMPAKLDERMIAKIHECYKIAEEELLELLDNKNIIKRNNEFKEGGFDYIKQNYPRIFEGVNSSKIRKATDSRKMVNVRVEKYDELKELWQKLNEKVILEYKFESESVFQELFTNYLRKQQNNFSIEGLIERIEKIEIQQNRAVVKEEASVYDRRMTSFSTMKYSDFLKELAKLLHMNVKTIHQAFIDSSTNINPYLNYTTIRVIKQGFEYYLMANAFDKFTIAYKKVSNSVHPTKLTDAVGNVLKQIVAGDVGVFEGNEKVADAYFFDELYYDSELEKENITTNLKEITVFTKIPKNSIKIPIAGGKSYSPDFAYVVKMKDETKKLHFVVESKNVDNEEGLRNEERYKIQHAEKYFGSEVKIEFRKQFGNKKIKDLIAEIVNSQS